MFDPRVARFGDPDFEAAEARLELTVRRDTDDADVLPRPGAAGAERLR